MTVTEKRKAGNIGEEIAVKYLQNKGFEIVARNYWKPWGEIDIVAKKDKILHFVEVKSVTRESMDFSPADNMHKEKRARQTKIIETYLLQSKWAGNYCVDLASIYLNTAERKAKIEFLENIEL